MKVTTVRFALKAGVALKRPELNIRRFSSSMPALRGDPVPVNFTLVPRPPR